MRKLLSLREVHQRVPDTALSWWRRLASERRIPTVRIGRRVFVDERDFEKFIEVRREPARTDIPL